MINVIRSNPIKTESLLTLQNELNVNSDNSFNPLLEVSEDDRSFYVRAELPGLSEELIQISLKDNSLIIEGEKKSETLNEEKNILKAEIVYGHFYRELSFNMKINHNNVVAFYKDGVLSLDLEKSIEDKIKIKVIHLSKNI